MIKTSYNLIDYTNIPYYHIDDKSCENLVLKAKLYGLRSIVVSPASLDSCFKYNKDNSVTIGVSIGYPSGAYTLESKLYEINDIIQNYPQVSEYYIVLSMGLFLGGEYEIIKKELLEISNLLNNKKANVVVEIGDLNDEQLNLLTKIINDSNIDEVVNTTGFREYGITIPSIDKTSQFIKLANGNFNVTSFIDNDDPAVAAEYFKIGSSRILTTKEFWLNEYRSK